MSFGGGYLFIFDFDGCITDWNDQLTYERAEIIAGLMTFCAKYGRIEIVSLANRAHIMMTVEQSGSKRLKGIFETIPWSKWSTVERREHLMEINSSRRESARKQREMILRVMKSEQWLQDPDCIWAYKKAHALTELSGSIPHNLVYFFDDNIYNIIFARENGFQAFLINNHPAMKEMNLRNVVQHVKSRLRSQTKKISHQSPLSVNNKKLSRLG